MISVPVYTHKWNIVVLATTELYDPRKVNSSILLVRSQVRFAHGSFDSGG
jgi:hypothetical protein